MSPKLSAPAAGGTSKALLSVALVGLIAVVLVIVGRQRPEVEPFDPRSGDLSGARGLVLLLEAQGATVDIVRSVPAASDDVRVLVLDDRLNDDQRADLERFVADGGVAVIADPLSPTSPTSTEDATKVSGSPPLTGRRDVALEANVDRGACSLPSAQHLRGVFVPDGYRFAHTDQPSCFGDNAYSVVVASAVGDGTVVAIGDNRMFTNEFLRFADNGGLATALLAPREGMTVAFVLGSEASKTVADIGTGERTLSDLVRPGVWMAIVQLIAAFVVFCIAKGVRVGWPVREAPAVPVAGSEFVVANGNLMQRADHSSRAAYLIQGDLYRMLVRRFHLSPTASIDEVDAELVRRVNFAPGRVRGVLQAAVHDPVGLLQLTSQTNAVQRDLDLNLTNASPMPNLLLTPPAVSSSSPNEPWSHQ